MVYLTVKALHIIAAILWVGGLFLVTFVTAKMDMSHDQLQRAIRVTDAAIGLTWLAGIALVIVGGWHTSLWLYIKVVFVVLISAIHTFTHRRWKAGTGEISHSALPYFLLSFALAVVVLVVFKRPM